ITCSRRCSVSWITLYGSDNLFCLVFVLLLFFIVFFCNATAPSELYTLSLHDALPICPGRGSSSRPSSSRRSGPRRPSVRRRVWRDRKSTRLNSSHLGISYAVFCLKKKKITSP